MLTEEDVRRIVREELARIDAERSARHSTRVDDLGRQVADAFNALDWDRDLSPATVPASAAHPQ